MSHWSERNIGVPTFGKAAPEPAVNAQLRLATPMLGGGAEAKKPDKDEPFRPTAVRDGIRFWWRRVWLAHYEGDRPLADLRHAEASVWGSTEKPGTTTVLVQSHTDQSPKRLDEWGGSSGRDVGYAWNLLKDGKNPENNPFVLTKAEGKLSVWAPGGAVPGLTEQYDNRALMIQAVQFWLLFGGVGARTRRGFGVLQWKGFEVDWDGIRSLLNSKGKEHPMSVLQGSKLLIGDPKQNAMEAWAASLKPYADFRKGNLPKAEQRPHHGPHSHSQWPEADVWRRHEKAQPRTHRNLPPDKHPVPRAALGLPMTIHFGKGERAEDGTLEYGDGGRYPSPVITRPIWKDGKWLPCILVLRTPPPSPDQIRWKDGSKRGRFDLDCLHWPARWWDRGDWHHQEHTATKAFVRYLVDLAKWREL